MSHSLHRLHLNSNRVTVARQGSPISKALLEAEIREITNEDSLHTSNKISEKELGNNMSSFIQLMEENILNQSVESHERAFLHVHDEVRVQVFRVVDNSLIPSVNTYWQRQNTKTDSSPVVLHN